MENGKGISVSKKSAFIKCVRGIEKKHQTYMTLTVVLVIKGMPVVTFTVFFCVVVDYINESVAKCAL